MPLYTTQYLKAVSERSTFSQSERIINESKSYTTFDIFLSHSFLDRQVVKGLFFELTSLGFKVYVDWIIDPHLDRGNVTKASAEHIRNRMKSSKSLLLAISTNASTSKWMPWELGFVDGNTTKCAVLPVSESSNSPESYTGFEYLKLYPFAKKRLSDRDEPKLWVIENATKYVVLDDFISSGMKPFTRNVNIF
ncbi:TIR domain-containing protein [Rufibacter immobilis]|uniref:TIR domain-containing protein n=1 Tax=Rufibacter immobilis TaxID=1348778 RepID=A0A3M9MTS5_9BACT|nr:TIR domain-containing protein [Rufibacter immobilis]RNI28920.1 TIR domain-containing protein [Rufibacter immobilis]